MHQLFKTDAYAPQICTIHPNCIISISMSACNESRECFNWLETILRKVLLLSATAKQIYSTVFSEIYNLSRHLCLVDPPNLLSSSGNQFSAIQIQYLISNSNTSSSKADSKECQDSWDTSLSQLTTATGWRNRFHLNLNLNLSRDSHCPCKVKF